MAADTLTAEDILRLKPCNPALAVRFAKVENALDALKIEINLDTAQGQEQFELVKMAEKLMELAQRAV